VFFHKDAAIAVMGFKEVRSEESLQNEMARNLAAIRNLAAMQSDHIIFQGI
jgi:hypothetical protein